MNNDNVCFLHSNKREERDQKCPEETGEVPMELATQSLCSNFKPNLEPSISFFLRTPQKRTERKGNQSHSPASLFSTYKSSAIPSQTPPKMADSKALQVFLFTVFIFSFLVTSSQPSLLPFVDPFRILEQTPFGLLENENRDALQQQTQLLPLARVDWKETAESHVIMVDVPGMNKEELKIEVDEENRVLKVIGERKREEEKQSEHWHRLERSYGKFWRQFRLPINADLESVKAQLQNGVLKITLSKLSPEKIKGPRVVGILDEKPPVAELNKSGGARQEL